MIGCKKKVSYLSTQGLTVHECRQHGFTLIEVLVALTIFSVAAVAASSASSSYISSVDRLRTKTLAHFVAQNKAADMRMQGQWQTGSSTDSVSEQGADWRITTKAVATPSDSIRRMEITVSQVDNASGADNAKPVQDLVVFVKKPE